MDVLQLIEELAKQAIRHEKGRFYEGKDMLGPPSVCVCDEGGALYRRFQIMLDHDGTILLVPTNLPE